MLPAGQVIRAESVEDAMKGEGKDCACGHGLSRRGVLKAGLAAAATAAIGLGGDALAEKEAEARVQTKQALTTAGVRPIDIHAHYYPQSFFDVFIEDGKRFGTEFHKTDEGFTYKSPVGNQPVLPMKFIDLKLRIADMDQQGIAMQAVSLTSPMVYWGDEDFSHKLSKAWNDGASAAHKQYPDRIVSLMILPMLYPDRAIDELNRASKLPGMRGVYMGTHIDDTHDLDDPLFEPIYSRIEALDLPVFLHPLQGYGGARMQPYYLSNLLGNPYDTAIAACKLIIGGVMDRHPKLQVCLPHGGGALPILIGRVDHGYRVRAEVKKMNLPKPPSEYLSRFTYDTIVHSKPIMEFLVQQVGAERVMVGSDYCFDMGYDRPLQFLEQINLSGAQRKMILGGNASRILKL
jgi:aminocarboxymuconate-semialdehyde decarboxylase